MAYGYGYLERGALILENIGLLDILLPFLLIFTIIFAVADKVKLLSERRYNAILALVISLSVVIPHITGSYPANMDVVLIMNKALPQVSLVVIAVIMILLLIGLFGGEASWIGGSLGGIIALVAFIIVIYIFGSAANLWGMSGRWTFLSNPETQAAIVALLVFGLVVWFIVKDPEKSKGESFMTKFGDMFRKGR